MSGVGFDVVPTDCLARYVAEKLPGATELEIAIAPPSNVSPGTLKSMFDGVLIGGLARRNGLLVSHPIGRDTKRVRFMDRERGVIAIRGVIWRPLIAQPGSQISRPTWQPLRARLRWRAPHGRWRWWVHRCCVAF